jgi:hypothetical protein
LTFPLHGGYIKDAVQLANLMPGVRELRAPLAAGYLWLLAAWLVLAERIPPEEEATGLLKSLYDLGDVATAIGFAIALSFAAYLVGIISQAILNPPLRELYSLVVYRLSRESLQVQLPYVSWYEESWDLKFIRARGLISYRGARALNQIVSNRLMDLWSRLPRGGLSELLHVELGEPPPSQAGPTSAREEWIDDARNPELSNSVAGRVFQELPVIATRLIGKEPELFAAQDRLKGESDFREAIVPPLLALGVIVALFTFPVWTAPVLAITLLFAGLIAREARKSNRDRNDLIIDALFLERVESPILERLVKRADASDRPPSEQSLLEPVGLVAEDDTG